MTTQAQTLSAGARFYKALEQERPLLLPGAINGYCARMAEHEGFRALYLSGGGVAAAMGLPDLAVIDLHDVAADAARITQVSQLPLLVDADTGFGSPLNINRAVKTLSAAGVAGLHLEDQSFLKRCGHRPNKALVSADEMAARLNAAAEARTDDSFIIMAATDALASETREQAVARAVAYVAAGADMLFVRRLKPWMIIAPLKMLAHKRRFWPTLPNLARHRFLPPMRLPPPVWILCSSRCRLFGR